MFNDITPPDLPDAIWNRHQRHHGKDMNEAEPGSTNALSGTTDPEAHNSGGHHQHPPDAPQMLMERVAFFTPQDVSSERDGRDYSRKVNDDRQADRPLLRNLYICTVGKAPI